MAKMANEASQAIITDYNDTKLSLFASKLVNTYSRLGRSYTTPNSTRTSKTASVSVMPIYATIGTSVVRVKRLVQGLLVRSPNHARVTTDRISYLSVEMHRPQLLPRMHQILRKHSLATGGSSGPEKQLYLQRIPTIFCSQTTPSL